MSNKFKYFLIALAIVIVVFIGFFILRKPDVSKVDNKSSEIKSEEIVFLKQGELKFLDKKTNSVIKLIDIEIAQDDYSREKGLMYRRNMAENQGMLFIFDNEEPRFFWMKNTYISLDIIYVSSNKTIVSIQKSAIPLSEESLPSNIAAKYVVEVNAGFVDRYGIKEGEKIDF